MSRLTPLRALLSRLAYPWKLDDPALVDAGLQGERVIAAIRLLLAACLLAIALRNVVAEPGEPEYYIGLGAAGAATLITGALYLLAKRGTTARLGFLTGAIDVTLVSAALATDLVLGWPQAAVSSKVVFEVYFLAIAATCLRYDWRVCVTSGLLATAQYAAIVGYAAWHWPLNAPAYAPYPYGVFLWSTQLSRFGLLLTATLLSAAIALRTRTLRRLATRDRLTGLANRGYFEERLEQAVARARHSGAPLSLAILDVDHFKRFNDTHGHLAGDAALRAVSGVLQAGVGAGEVVARYGGEEFVLLFPATPVAAAVARLEALRAALGALQIPLASRSGLTGELTVSVGVASWPEDGPSLEDAIDAADRRLFAAKAHGRNLVLGPPRATERLVG